MEVDYHRIGNMKRHMGETVLTTLLHQLRDMWKSPRGTVIRIQALALLAIILSFFLSIFGSCRRWSNRWIVQKGFLAAQVLSLSLGTYSIGLMQSSWVKSEMYSIWAVSLLTLFGCVDPVSTYIGLDYKGTLLKVIFQLCLYCGYVLLMSVSTISGVLGNIAINMLLVITLIKGFHRSLALVLPSKTLNQVGEFVSKEPSALAGSGDGLDVHFPVHRSETKGSKTKEWESRTTTADVDSSINEMPGKLQLEITDNDKTIIKDVCLGYSLSHLLQRRFLGLDTTREMEEKRKDFKTLVNNADRAIDYKRTLKVIEVELGFLYEVFFTSNEFLHYSEAKTSSFWALASFIGICLVGVAAAVPGTMACRHCITSTGRVSGTVTINTTTADLVITLVILVSLALLQLVQLIRCWASNWARVTFACKYAATKPKSRRECYTVITKGSQSITDREQYWSSGNEQERPRWWWRLMGLKALVITRISWFDKQLWQDKLGQYSVVPDRSWREESSRKCLRIVQSPCLLMPQQPQERSDGRGGCYHNYCRSDYWCGGLYPIRDRLRGMLGLPYIGVVLRELWGGDTNTLSGVRLHDDVKTCIAKFLDQIESRRIGKDWSSLFVHNGLLDASLYLPYNNAPLELDGGVIMPHAYAFAHRVMVWHIATCYCQQAELEKQIKEEEEESTGTAGGGGDREKHRRVAISLSKYCAYLVVSAPELLPGPSGQTKRAIKKAALCTGIAMQQAPKGLNAMLRVLNVHEYEAGMKQNDAFLTGVYWGKMLRNEKTPLPPDQQCTRRGRCSDPWEVLALLWVQTLLYAAPYGDVEAHRQHLSQGGEFITHLWALLYHLGIDKWEHVGAEET